MALSDELDELARKHGATSYRNRADTQNPAYGFTPAGLLNLIAEVTGEVRKQPAAQDQFADASKTMAPSGPALEPLTDEQIEAIAKPYLRSVGDHWCSETAIPDNGKIEEFARAIEAAHGITAAPKVGQHGALSDQLDELARKHGATSYRNRADTQNPAYGFTQAGLLNLLAEVTGDVRKQDEALIRQLVEALNTVEWHGGGGCWAVDPDALQDALTAARKWLEGGA